MSNMQQYKCPCCGGAIEFNTQNQKVTCPFCDTSFDMEVFKEMENQPKDNQKEALKWDTNAGTEWKEGEQEGMQVFSCDSCGGEIIVDGNRAADRCPYCDNPVVLKGRFEGSLRPDYVIPFKLDKKAAKKGMEEHLSHKRFLPKVFKKENHIDEIKGIYVPFWLFDAKADANIQYRGTKVRHWEDSEYDYTETSYYDIYRSGNLKFENIPVDGSTQMPDDLMQSIEPFDMKEAVDFETAYLAGFLADKYDVTAKDSQKQANKRIRQSAQDALRDSVHGYYTVEEEQTNIKLKSGKAKYALYPVWILNTTWKGEHYLFAMNGQTGKFVGNLPCDKGIFRRYFIILFIIFTIIFDIIANLFI